MSILLFVSLAFLVDRALVSIWLFGALQMPE